MGRARVNLMWLNSIADPAMLLCHIRNGNLPMPTFLVWLSILSRYVCAGCGLQCISDSLLPW